MDALPTVEQHHHLCKRHARIVRAVERIEAVHNAHVASWCYVLGNGAYRTRKMHMRYRALAARTYNAAAKIWMIL